MNVQTQHESVLKLLSIKVISASFELVGDMENNIKLDLDINKKLNVEEEVYTLTLETRVSAVDNINIETTTKAEFTVDNVVYNDDIKELVEKNGTAIMFPYIRSYITSLTNQPGISPIILPAININNLIDDIKKEENNI